MTSRTTYNGNDLDKSAQRGESEMKFKKLDSNQHGHIVEVFHAQGWRLGTIAKWHGLFIPSDWRGEKFSPRKTRKEAADVLLQIFELERDEAVA